MSRRLGRALRDVREGRARFDALAAENAKDLDGIVKWLIRKFPPPPSSDAEDLRQEVLLAMWGAIGSWDPDRGRTLRGHCTFVAIDRGRKWLRKERREDHGGVPRHALSEAALTARDDMPFVCGDEPSAAGQDRICEAVERLRARLRDAVGSEAIALAALLESEWDEDAAAQVVYLERAREAGVASFAAARNLVTQAMRSVA